MQGIVLLFCLGFVINLTILFEVITIHIPWLTNYSLLLAFLIHQLLMRALTNVLQNDNLHIITQDR